MTIPRSAQCASNSFAFIFLASSGTAAALPMVREVQRRDAGCVGQGVSLKLTLRWPEKAAQVASVTYGQLKVRTQGFLAQWSETKPEAMKLVGFPFVFSITCGHSLPRIAQVWPPSPVKNPNFPQKSQCLPANSPISGWNRHFFPMFFRWKTPWFPGRHAGSRRCMSPSCSARRRSDSSTCRPWPCKAISAWDERSFPGVQDDISHDIPTIYHYPIHYPMIYQLCTILNHDISHLVGGFNHPEKYDLVNGVGMKTHIWNGKQSKCLKPPTR